MAGYSGTPLPKKLGIKDGHRIVLLDAPRGFTRTLGELPEGVEIQDSLRGTTPCDVIVLFASSEKHLRQRFEKAAARLSTAGGLWVSWPKKASGVATELSEGIVRQIGLQSGLVDNKICAIDETWSGLRFVRRVTDRR